MSKDKPNIIVKNKTASRNFILGETFQAGIVLEGWEVKSLRNSKIDVKRAKGLARQLNEPEDPEIVERFVQLIEEYGYKAVRKANNITAKLRVENPKRHIGYTISVLKGQGPG